MSNPYFKFKQFTVFHDKCAMKVGVDGVTLGAWADVSGVKSILDIGCGSGLISLMLAQRSEAQITAIDVDEQCVVQTKENIGNSPWDHRIKVIHTSVQEFAKNMSEKFDLIVSNPPYFINSLKNPSETRTLARHNDSLSHEELIESAQKMLRDGGKFCLILPVNEGNLFVQTAKSAGLYCSKVVTVYPNNEKPAKRMLLELRRLDSGNIKTNLTIEKERNEYTPEYTKLVRDFYLKL